MSPIELVEINAMLGTPGFESGCNDGKIDVDPTLFRVCPNAPRSLRMVFHPNSVDKGSQCIEWPLTADAVHYENSSPSALGKSRIAV
jgi:hypothetical protein